jgi:hypothetical protein
MSQLRAKQIKLVQNGLLYGGTNGNGSILEMPTAEADAHKVLKIKSDRTGFEYATLAGANVSVVPTGNLAATSVQGALDELQGDIDSINTSAGTLQTEVDAIETSVGLNVDGTKPDFTSTNYIGAGDSFFTAVNTLDLELDSLDSSVVKLTGNQSIAGTKTFSDYVVLSNIPTQQDHAATKAYVDGVAAGLDVKQSVRAASTGDVDFTTGGLLTIDGVSLIAGDRVLLKNQEDAFENGIYVVTAEGPWVRAVDMNEAGEFVGAFFFVEEGTLNADNGFVCTTNGTVIVGTTAINFTQFSGAGQIDAGNGLTKLGNTLNVVGTADRITANADSIDIASTYAGQTSIVTLGTVTTGTWNGSVVGQAYGGLGANVSGFAATSLILAGAGTATELQKGANSTVLKVDGNGDLAYAKVDLTVDVSGILPEANGGTGYSTYSEGDLLVGNDENGLTTLGKGSANQVLTSNGTTLVYGYVSAVRDGSGVSVASVVVQTDENAKLQAAIATVTSDNTLVYTTKGYVDSAVGAAERSTVVDTFVVVASGATTGQMNAGANASMTLTQTPIGDVSVAFNGLVLRKNAYSVSGTTVTLVDSTIGYSAETDDVLTVSYIYNA